MKKLLLFILFVVCTTLPAVAKQVFPPAYDVAKVGDSTRVRMPEENWQIYRVDGGSALTFKEVASEKYADNFTHSSFFNSLSNPSTSDVFGMVENLAAGSKWVRFKLVNSATATKKVFLTCNGSADKFYIFQNKKWNFFKNGVTEKWAARDGDKNNNRILVSVPPGEVITVYVNTNMSSAVPVLYDHDTAIKEDYLEQLVFDEVNTVQFGFAGFIAFALVFNLFFYYINRERLYLNYAIMLFFIAAISSWETIVLLWLPWAMAYKIEIFVFLVGGFAISFINTFKLFLNFRQYSPFWDGFLKYFVWFSAVSAFVAVVFIYDIRPYFKNATPMLVFFTMVFLVCFLLMSVAFVAFIVILIKTLIKLKKKKDPEAQIIFWAIVPYFVTFLPYTPDYTLLTAMWGVALLSWGMFARFKRLQEEYVQQALEKERLTREKEEEKNALIAEQNARLEQLVDERTAELEASLENLKQTQAQLIQSEKMASLGELTAGIAHEIQNPLNFVNNFSDVSVELLEEMEEELDKGDTEEVKAIAGDIKQNLEKIAHHGRRADSIVKGMLQHSRTSSGQKEPTNINALADEYLRLAYHGLRAKDKTFNAELVTHFEENLPHANVLPQDMGRVLLNMFTNAFYATQQKAKLQQADYKPSVSVTTELVGKSVKITVRDNGTGIPDEIKDKILQPFFTTKPTGEGTGLGLSLSYDIVVKAHGGSIEIDSKEGEFTAFVITVPVN